MTTKMNNNDNRDIKFTLSAVTDESSPSCTGPMARQDDDFSEIEVNLEVDIAKEKETKWDGDEPPAKRVKV